MVSRKVAGNAVRSKVEGPERGELLFILSQQTDDQLSQWGIEDGDGDDAIVTFMKRKAQGAAAGPGTGSAAAAGLPVTRSRAPEPMGRFWQSLVTSNITAGSFLMLPSGTYLLGDPKRGSVLLVRDCYWGLFNRIKFLKGWKPKGSEGSQLEGFKSSQLEGSQPKDPENMEVDTRFLVTGTPGIGKTCFAVPLMGWLVKEGMASKIVLEVHQQRYLFTTTSNVSDVEQGSTTDFTQELNDPEVWWIVDMGTAVERAANTVLLASPDRGRYKEFLKLLGATTLFMPVWTDDEIEGCRVRLFPKLAAGQVEELQSKWGNIPRYVLEKAEDAPAQATLDAAISTCRWDDLMHCIGEPDSAPHASHKLLHLEVVGEEYNAKVMKLASPYVARKLERLAGVAHVQQLKKLVQTSLDEPAYAAAAGAFFETYTHRLFQEGGQFEVRHMGIKPAWFKRTKSMLSLPKPSCTHIFKKLEEVSKQKDNVYCIPRVHNFPAVDAIMQPGFLFQMTITQKQRMNEDGLAGAVRQLRGVKRLYFVVPATKFDEYRLVSGVPEDVEQWVLSVPWA